MTDILFLIIVVILAILYSSVGHGGASGYLALMALWGIAPEIMRPSALILNVFVSAIAFYSFYKNGHFRMKLLWPFMVTSVPFAFLGGMISVNTKDYKIILGIFLIIAVFRIFVHPQRVKESKKAVNIYLAMIIGVLLGFLSGLIGIGGGIILSPIILLLGWANVKETSAVSALFILLNSVSGFSGLILHGVQISPEIGYMIFAGIFGGIIGSGLGSFVFSDKLLRYSLTVVLIFASIKLLVF